MTMRTMQRTLLAAVIMAAATPVVADPAGGPPATAPTATAPTATAPGTPSVVRSLVVHLPPGTTTAGEPLQLEAFLDAPLAETLVVRWRVLGERAWHEAAFERSSAGGWFARLPPAASPGIEYYVAGRGSDGAERAHFASATSPHVVRVQPTEADRLEELDDERLGGRRNRLAIDVDGHDFGNRYGRLDRFIRAEATFTHRLGGPLYEILFGFGVIQGATPLESMPGGDNLKHGLRYGSAGVRVRAHPVIFVDAKTSIGVSHDGFAAGAAGAVTLGRPWRSNVSFGGEWLQDLGPSAFVRLQWDTAPPLLMAAAIVRTDLPGAIIDENGMFIRYEVIYRAFGMTSIRGALSFGSRDGPAHFGGGLGAAVDF